MKSMKKNFKISGNGISFLTFHEVSFPKMRLFPFSKT